MTQKTQLHLIQNLQSSEHTLPKRNLGSSFIFLFLSPRNMLLSSFYDVCSTVSSGCWICGSHQEKGKGDTTEKEEVQQQQQDEENEEREEVETEIIVIDSSEEDQVHLESLEVKKEIIILHCRINLALDKLENHCNCICNFMSLYNVITIKNFFTYKSILTL